MEKHIVYRTENTINKRFYYGVTKVEGRNFKTYLGSGKLLMQAIERYGKENFVRRTVKEFNSEQDALNFEALIVDQDFVDRRDCYNITLGGGKPPACVTPWNKGMKGLTNKGSFKKGDEAWNKGLEGYKGGQYDRTDKHKLEMSEMKKKWWANRKRKKK